MTEQPAKAAIIPLHEPFILASEDGQWHRTLCGTPGCGYESPEFNGRRYLAEIAADEHIRACANWPTIQEDSL